VLQVSRCRTLDQAHALVTFLDAASEKTLRSTLALTASRGRGKSAALGLAIAGEHTECYGVAHRAVYDEQQLQEQQLKLQHWAWPSQVRAIYCV
jgi:hypothetical protein